MTIVRRSMGSWTPPTSSAPKRSCPTGADQREPGPTVVLGRPPPQSRCKRTPDTTGGPSLDTDPFAVKNGQHLGGPAVLRLDGDQADAVAYGPIADHSHPGRTFTRLGLQWLSPTVSASLKLFRRIGLSFGLVNLPNVAPPWPRSPRRHWPWRGRRWVRLRSPSVRTGAPREIR